MSILDLLGGNNQLGGQYGMDPLQQSLQQFQRPPPQPMQPGPTGNGIMSALRGVDPTALMMLGSSLLQASGPQPGRSSVGQRFGSAMGQALPQILNQQSVQERTALAKQEIDMRKADQKMQADAFKAVQDQASAFLKSAIPGDADKNGILDANEKRALPYVKLAHLTGKPEYLAKAEEMLNPEPAKASSPMGKLVQDFTNGTITKDQFDQGYAAMIKPQTEVNIGDKKPIGASEAQNMRNDAGEMPPPNLTVNEAVAAGYHVIKPLTPEAAAKEQMYATAKEQLPKIGAMLFNKDNSVNRTNVTTSSAMPGGIPMTPGAELSAMYETGIQALTRGETGAAMPPSEVENTRRRFQPRLVDSDAVVKIKWQMYQEMIGGGLKLIRVGHGGKPEFDTEKFDAELKKRLDSTPDASTGWSIAPVK